MTDEATSESGSGHVHNEGCLHCGLDYDFVLPGELVNTAHDGDLVIFAGAGVSTEVPAVFPTTFYETVQEALDGEEAASFPELMESYVSRFGRQSLLRLLKKRLDYVDSFPSIAYAARRFHAELATMPYMRDIITTNWDTFFEQECMATPFVTGGDFTFHDMPGRRVYKIHGSMNNVSSIVMTESDYGKRLEELRDSALGGTLRQLLATKSVVFVGYSLRDWNFRRLYDALRSDMGDLAPRAYFVSPFPSAEAESLNLAMIRTSGVHFLRQIKQRLIADAHFVSDEAYSRIAEVEMLVLEAKDILATYSHKKYPALVHCWAYHDGLVDACGRILRRRGTGEYSDGHRVLHLARMYDTKEEQALSAGKYWEAAYISGYANVLLLLLEQEGDGLTETIPLYLNYGAESAMRSEEDLAEALEQSRRRAPKARSEGRVIAARVAEGMVASHGPFLD